MDERTKMRERNLFRALTCSICGILVCMMCLAGTTWAWFAVELDAGTVVIEIGTPTDMTAQITQGDTALAADQGALELTGGTYAITLSLSVPSADRVRDELGYAPDVYAIMTVVVQSEEKEESQSYWVLLGDDCESYMIKNITVAEGTTATVSFASSWFQPNNALPLSTEPMLIGEEPAEEPTETTEVTEESTEESTESSSEPTEPSNEEPTEQTTEEPTTEPTEPSTGEPASEPTEPSKEENTEPTSEPTDPSTEESTESTEESTEPTSEPTSEPTESTEPME